MIFLDNRWWNLPMAFIVRGVTTQFYEKKMSVAYTTARYILPEVCASPPSCPRILDMCSHVCLYF